MSIINTLADFIASADYSAETVDIGSNVRGARVDDGHLVLFVTLGNLGPSKAGKETLIASAGRKSLPGSEPDGFLPDSGKVTVLVTGMTPEQGTAKTARQRAARVADAAVVAAAATPVALTD